MVGKRRELGVKHKFRQCSKRKELKPSLTLSDSDTGVFGEKGASVIHVFLWKKSMNYYKRKHGTTHMFDFKF